MHLETGADQFRALSHELEAEVPPATSRDRGDVEPSSVVADGEDPFVSVDRAGDGDGGGRAVLPHILQCFLQDAQRIRDTADGTVDIVAHTMTITCDRLKMIDFSSVYFEAHQKVLVLKNSSATSLDDLHGQKVCATSGSDSLARISQHHAIPVKVTYWTDCLVRLQQGRVAAISTDDSILDGLAAQDPWTKIIGKPLTDEPYGLAISKQHPEFVRFVNAVLQQLRTDGQWKASYAHWLGHPVPNPPSAQYAG